MLADGVADYNWTEKGREICGLFTAYGDREFQGEVLYRTKLRGEDGISFYFDDGYTYFPWPSLANLLDALIETGVYPDVAAEEEPDPIGDYNIPDEIEEMGGVPQREIGQADYDYVLGAVAYEAGETAEEPVRPQAVFTEIKGIPKADEIDSFVPEPVAGGQQVIVAGDQDNLIPPAEESPSPHESRGNTTAHKNFRRFQKLFPEIVSGQYESLRLEAGDAYDPLVIHHKYGAHYCMEHYYMQNGDRMYDPYMDFLIDREAGTLRAFSYENSGIGVYQEADPADPTQEKRIAGFGQFFATWLNNIASQGYEPVRATMLVNDEEVDVELRPAPEAAPAAEAEEPEQLSLLASPPERSPEDLLIERAMLRGPLNTQKKERIYEFALTHPTGSAFASFLKEMYGYEGFPDEAAGLDYVYSGTDSIELHWTDEHGEKRETKLSWPQVAGIQQLLSIGVVNLITAETLEDAADELREALSDEGMQRYVSSAPASSQPEPRQEPALEPEDEITPYRWNAKNVRIAVAGAQRRSGVTVTAFNLAAWLTARGAEVAYIEVNTNRHLQLLLNVYEAAPTGEHYAIDGIDCYLTNEPDRDYQFVIYDCGVMQSPTSVFREADYRLLCGSVLPYEIPAFHKALEVCGGLEVCQVAISVPGEFREYCRELFGGGLEMAEASHDLFANRTNGRLYRRLVEPYIMGERRL